MPTETEQEWRPSQGLSPMAVFLGTMMHYSAIADQRKAERERLAQAEKEIAAIGRHERGPGLLEAAGAGRSQSK